MISTGYLNSSPTKNESPHKTDLDSTRQRRGTTFTGTSHPSKLFQTTRRGTIALGTVESSLPAGMMIPRLANIQSNAEILDHSAPQKEKNADENGTKAVVSPRSGSIFKDPKKQHHWQSIVAPTPSILE